MRQNRAGCLGFTCRIPIELPFAALVFFLTLGMFSRAAAQEFQITVREIVAENTGRGCDPALKDIEEDLGKLNYTTYRLENTFRHSLAAGQEKTIILQSDNRFSFSPESFEEGKIRLRVKISSVKASDRSLDTILRIQEGGTGIIGGISSGKGTLIVAFTVSR